MGPNVEMEASSQTNTRVNWLQRALVASFLFTVGAVYQFGERAFALGVIPSSWKWTMALAAGIILAVGLLVLSIVAWTPLKRILLRLLQKVDQILIRARGLNLLVFIATLGFFPLLILGPYGSHFGGLLLRFFILWVLALLGGSCLFVYARKGTWFENVLFSLVLQGVLHRFLQYIPWVSTFPFSLGYSEGARFYYASLFFSEKIYGIEGLGWPLLHPSRYLMQSLPFIIPALPLWFHRFWQVLLWIGMTTATGIVLVRRLRIEDRFKRWVWLLWAILFLYQGPVYYHLLVMVVLILWATDTKRPLRTMGVVTIASFWAGISRVNWIPMPGLLAATLYFLERPKEDQTALWRYLRAPFLWMVLGGLIGLGSQAGYAQLSGAEENWLGSSLSSTLLWARLLPSPSYKTGVIPALLLAGTPIIVMLINRFLTDRRSWHPIRPLALTGTLALFLAGGLVVSAKIGGGDDLHNLDAFLILLLVIGTYVVFDRVNLNQGRQAYRREQAWQVGAWIFLVPIFFTAGTGAPLRSPYAYGTNAILDMESIQREVTQTLENGGEVLFIAERHLLTFHYIEGVELEPKYEKTFMMEMAMSDNREYFDAFEKDLAIHKWDLIIVSPLRTRPQVEDHPFSEEDNAWFQHSSKPLREYYAEIARFWFGSGGIAFMVPKP
jgi:hypothetical protein